jgi:hypothetical protein
MRLKRLKMQILKAHKAIFTQGYSPPRFFAVFNLTISTQEA